MSKQLEFRLTPLHLAVIDGDEAAVESLKVNAELLESREACGFTPLELAQLLGKRRCQQLLGGVMPSSVKIQDKGADQVVSLTVEEFEKTFNLVYRPFLVFESYTQLVEVIRSCPYLLRSQRLAKENYEWGRLYSKELATGTIADVSIRWINESMGYGVFAEADIPEGSFIGEYTGVVRRLYRRYPNPNAYCFRYPTRLWSLKYFAIDALHESNVLRFINHSDRPNLLPLCAVDRRLLHQLLFANRLIPKGQQLTFDYGPDYWVRRQKLLLDFTK